MSSGSSTKPSAVKTMVSNAKFDVEKFDGTNNFSIGQCEVMDVWSNKSCILLWMTHLQNCLIKIGRR